MKRLALLFILAGTTNVAMAKFTDRLGCSPTSVTVAQDGVEKITNEYNSGTASELDVARAKAHLADMRYCAGDTLYPISAYCTLANPESKMSQLWEILKIQRARIDSGTLPAQVRKITLQEIADFRKFCALHKNDME